MRKTIVEYLESRLSRERLFVEAGETEPTVEAARFGLETLEALGADLSGVRNSTSAFLSYCRLPEAGYKDRRSADMPALNATYYAMRLMSRGLVPGSLADPHATVEWVRGLVMMDGCIRPGIDIDDLYYAVRAIQFALSPHPMREDDRRAIVEFVRACEAPKGGFGFRPGDPGDIERTYCCVNLLETLGYEGGIANHRDYIAACMTGGDVCWDPDRTKATPATFYWGLRAASLSGSSAPWHEAGRRIEDFRSADGGYGLAGRSELWHTYCCVNALNLVAAHTLPREAQHVARV